jgi:hypothetical protein
MTGEFRILGGRESTVEGRKERRLTTEFAEGTKGGMRKVGAMKVGERCVGIGAK